MGIGQPDFATPEPIVEAAVKALRDGAHGYTPSAGTPSCRQAVSDYIARHRGVEVPADRVLITPGGKVAMSFAMMALFQPGAEIIIPDPGFPTYGIFADYLGYQVNRYSLDPELGFSFRADEIESLLTQDTRLLILNSPGNPTGGASDPEQLEQLIRVLERFPNCFVLSDEIYSRLQFGCDFAPSLIGRPELEERLIILDGWSKSYAMTGWRLGWSIWPQSLIEPASLLATHMHSCVNASGQAAGIAALSGDQSSVAAMRNSFESRRDLVVGLLNQIPGISCVQPHGAFYAFPDISALGISAAQAQHDLLEDHGVATIAGTSFGNNASGNLRLSFAASQADLIEGIHRISQWASNR